METNDLANNLKELRRIRGMSQEYLAEVSRVSLRTIQRIENNESNPTGETIKRIANALDVQLNDLIGKNLVLETNDLKATIVFLKKQRSKTTNSSDIKTFDKFIALLNKLKEKDLSNEQKEGIEHYIQYLELEKIPSFSNDIYRKKLNQFKKYLKSNLRFVPNNFYATWIASFAISFATAFAVQSNIAFGIKISVVLAALLCIGIGILLDLRIKRQNRSLNF